MPKITEYPQATKFDANDILLKDGLNGTKKIQIEDFIADVSDISKGKHGKLAGADIVAEKSVFESQTGTVEQTGWTAVGDKLCISLAAGVTSVTFDGEGHIQTASSGSYTNCKCIQIQASEGDAFIVTAKGQGSSVRVYAFIKSDGTVIERGASNTTFVNETLYAPRGTAYFVVNDTLGTGRVWAGKPISMQAENIKPVCYKENIEETVEGVTTVTHKYLHMFVPTANKKHYLYYLFTWVNNETNNALGWGLTEIHLYDLAFRNIKQLTTNGEVEMAINIDGRSDYIGIRNHGDEIQTDFKLYVDGHEIGENDTFSKRNFAKIQMYSKFTMYDPNDHTTIVGYHTRIDTINALDRTVTIENKVEFAATLTLNAGYLFMLPIMRTYLGAQVTDTFIDNQDYILTDCSGQDWDPNDASTHVFSPDDDHGGVGKVKHDSTEYKFWGEDYGLNGYARILRRIAPNGVTQSNRISNDNAYNKLYMSVCANGESVTNGDVWILETELYLDCGYDHL